MIIYNDTFYCSYSSSIHQLYTVDTAIIQNVYDQEGKRLIVLYTASHFNDECVLDYARVFYNGSFAHFIWNNKWRYYSAIISIIFVL